MPSHRMNIEFNITKCQYEKTLGNIQKMTEPISDAIEKYKELIQDNYSYR